MTPDIDGDEPLTAWNQMGSCNGISGIQPVNRPVRETYVIYQNREGPGHTCSVQDDSDQVAMFQQPRRYGGIFLLPTLDAHPDDCQHARKDQQDNDPGICPLIL